MNESNEKAPDEGASGGALPKTNTPPVDAPAPPPPSAPEPPTKTVEAWLEEKGVPKAKAREVRAFNHRWVNGCSLTETQFDEGVKRAAECSSR